MRSVAMYVRRASVDVEYDSGVVAAAAFAARQIVIFRAQAGGIRRRDKENTCRRGE